MLNPMENTMFNIFLIILGLTTGKFFAPEIDAGFFMIAGIILIWLSRPEQKAIR